MSSAPEKRKENNARYYARNKEKIQKKRQLPDVKLRARKRAHEYYLKNRERILASSKSWRERSGVNFYRRYHKKYLQLNPVWRITRTIRSRLHKLVKSGGVSVSSLIGCSSQELRTYLESKFQDGMMWDNYGYRGWHVDHVVPLSKFDMTDRAQVSEACHFTNLQPLWAEENMRKSNKD